MVGHKKTFVWILNDGASRFHIALTELFATQPFNDHSSNPDLSGFQIPTVFCIQIPAKEQKARLLVDVEVGLNELAVVRAVAVGN